MTIKEISASYIGKIQSIKECSVLLPIEVSELQEVINTTLYLSINEIDGVAIDEISVDRLTIYITGTNLCNHIRVKFIHDEDFKYLFEASTSKRDNNCDTKVYDYKFK